MAAFSLSFFSSSLCHCTCTTSSQFILRWHNFAYQDNPGPITSDTTCQLNWFCVCPYDKTQVFREDQNYRVPSSLTLAEWTKIIYCTMYKCTILVFAWCRFSGPSQKIGMLSAATKRDFQRATQTWWNQAEAHRSILYSRNGSKIWLKRTIAIWPYSQLKRIFNPAWKDLRHLKRICITRCVSHRCKSLRTYTWLYFLLYHFPYHDYTFIVHT